MRDRHRVVEKERESRVGNDRNERWIEATRGRLSTLVHARRVDREPRSKSKMGEEKGVNDVATDSIKPIFPVLSSFLDMSLHCGNR